MFWYQQKNDINNENVRKTSSTKRVFIVGDSIVKPVNEYFLQLDV